MQELLDALQDHQALKDYRKFLRRQGNDQRLRFFFELSKYKKTKTEKARKRRAQMLYKTYFEWPEGFSDMDRQIKDRVRWKVYCTPAPPADTFDESLDWALSALYKNYALYVQEKANKKIRNRSKSSQSLKSQDDSENAKHKMAKSRSLRHAETMHENEEWESRKRGITCPEFSPMEQSTNS